MNAIEIQGLEKSFRGLYALDGLNMTVPVGAIYGFIGKMEAANPPRKSRSAAIWCQAAGRSDCLEKSTPTPACALVSGR